MPLKSHATVYMSSGTSSAGRILDTTVLSTCSLNLGRLLSSQLPPTDQVRAKQKMYSEIRWAWSECSRMSSLSATRSDSHKFTSDCIMFMADDGMWAEQ